MALDSLQNISQNDFLHYDDAHVMQYFVSSFQKVLFFKSNIDQNVSNSNYLIG